MCKRIKPEEQKRLIRTKLIGYIRDNKHVPVKMYYVRNKQKADLVKDLKEAGKFFGLSHNTMTGYNFHNHNNLGAGKLFFAVNVKNELGCIINEIEKR